MYIVVCLIGFGLDFKFLAKMFLYKMYLHFLHRFFCLWNSYYFACNIFQFYIIDIVSVLKYCLFLYFNLIFYYYTYTIYLLIIHKYIFFVYIWICFNKNWQACKSFTLMSVRYPLIIYVYSYINICAFFVFCVWFFFTYTQLCKRNMFFIFKRIPNVIFM